MNYTAKEIDKMEIEEIESLAQMLSEEEIKQWTAKGYSGKSYVEIISNRKK